MLAPEPQPRFPVAWCHVCSRIALVHRCGLGNGWEVPRCLHCDAPLEDVLHVTAAELDSVGYIEHKAEEGCGCGSGGSGCSTDGGGCEGGGCATV
jgi:hypothetical protein